MDLLPVKEPSLPLESGVPSRGEESACGGSDRERGLAGELCTRDGVFVTPLPPREGIGKGEVGNVSPDSSKRGTGRGILVRITTALVLLALFSNTS